MPNCDKCGAKIIKGDEIIGCEHFPKDDLTEYSGKLISDGISQAKADWAAIQAQQRVLDRGKQGILF